MDDQLRAGLLCLLLVVAWIVWVVVSEWFRRGPKTTTEVRAVITLQQIAGLTYLVALSITTTVKNPDGTTASQTTAPATIDDLTIVNPSVPTFGSVAQLPADDPTNPGAWTFTASGAAADRGELHAHYTDAEGVEADSGDDSLLVILIAGGDGGTTTEKALGWTLTPLGTGAPAAKPGK